MMMIKTKYIRLITLGLMLLALPACAIEPKAAHHSFSFGDYGENQNIEILNYLYGDSKLTFTRPADWELEKGHIGQGGIISAVFPVGDSLYVKWRILSTGKVYEDKVDLKSRLPSDMNGKIIHFVIKGPQLYVYLIEGNDSGQLHAHKAIDCPLIAYKDFKCSEIYPEHWANF